MFYRYFLLNFVLICSANFNALKAQKFLFSRNKISLKSGLILSTGNYSPFLIRSNEYGLVPLKSQIGYFSGDVKLEYDSLYTQNKELKPFGFGYGFSPHFNFGKSNQLLIAESYVKLRYKVFEFEVGRRKGIQGLVDTVGSMGSYIYSGNALPIPKVEILISNFIPILGNGLISIKGNYLHGWFGRGDSVQNVLLHQKSLYLRIGKPSWKIRMIGGFNHQVQWGGKPARPFYDATSKKTISRYNSDLETYLKVVSGVSLNRKGDGINLNPSENEATNRVGNHLGTLDLGLEINIFGKELKIYRQNIFEDGSLFYLNNISDGLNGISLKIPNGIVRNVCFEFFNTTNQGGDVFYNIPQLRGRDNYFNNSVYVDNWTYNNFTIGNSLMTRSGDINIDEVKNENSILNNLKAINLSFNMILFKKFNLKTQLLDYKNFGNYELKINKDQFSILQEFSFVEKNNTYIVKLSSDIGSFWKNNLGLVLEFKKNLPF